MRPWERRRFKFAAHDGAGQRFIVGVKQVESGIAAAILFDSLREFVQLVSPGVRIFDGRKELQIAAVGRFGQFAQSGQAVDGLLHGCPFGFL
jgi:hypothetical protein